MITDEDQATASLISSCFKFNANGRLTVIVPNFKYSKYAIIIINFCTAWILNGNISLDFSASCVVVVKWWYAFFAIANVPVLRVLGTNDLVCCHWVIGLQQFLLHNFRYGTKCATGWWLNITCRNDPPTILVKCRRGTAPYTKRRNLQVNKNMIILQLHNFTNTQKNYLCYAYTCSYISSSTHSSFRSLYSPVRLYTNIHFIAVLCYWEIMMYSRRKKLSRYISEWC